MSNRNFAGISLLYFFMGVVTGLLGTIIAMVSSHTKSTTSGLVMALFNAGALIGIATFNKLSKRYLINSVVFAGSFVMAISLFLIVQINILPTILILAALLGTGFGIIDLGLAQIMTRTKVTSIFRVNLSNAIFGLGGITGSYVIHLFDTAALTAISWLTLISVCLATFALRDHTSVILNKESKGSNFHPFSVVFPILIATALYVAVEISASSWLPTLSTLNGHGIRDGALATSFFFLFFTAGRFIGAPIARRIHARMMITFSLSLSMIPLLMSVVFINYTIWLVALTGLTLGPIFANTTSLIASVTPDNPAATTLLLYSAMVGSLIIFPAIGFILGNQSYRVFSEALAVLVILSLTFYLLGIVGARKLYKDVQ